MLNNKWLALGYLTIGGVLAVVLVAVAVRHLSQDDSSADQMQNHRTFMQSLFVSFTEALLYASLNDNDRLLGIINRLKLMDPRDPTRIVKPPTGDRQRLREARRDHAER